MKEYRLKKWYPSLPENWRPALVIVVERDGRYELHPSLKHKIDSSYNEGTLISITNALEVEDNPDFWEELNPVEKEYEIISFQNPTSKKIFSKRDDGNFSYSNESMGHTEPYMLKNTPCILYSVKRLSDGEIFTVGDKAHLTNGNYYNSTISGFEITFNEYGLERYRNRETLKVGLQSSMYLERDPTFFEIDMIKIRKFMFKSYDGVDIFEGDKVWGVVHNSNEPFSTTQLEKAAKESWYKFSSKEEVIDHIIRERPVLTASEITNIIKPYLAIDKTLTTYAALYDAIKKKLNNS